MTSLIFSMGSMTCSPAPSAKDSSSSLTMCSRSSWSTSTFADRMVSTYWDADLISTEPPSDRWPYVLRPDAIPAASKGTTSSPKRATSQRMGREKRTFLGPHFMFFGKYASSTNLGRISGSTSAVGRASVVVTTHTNRRPSNSLISRSGRGLRLRREWGSHQGRRGFRSGEGCGGAGPGDQGVRRSPVCVRGDHYRGSSNRRRTSGYSAQVGGRRVLSKEHEMGPQKCALLPSHSLAGGSFWRRRGPLRSCGHCIGPENLWPPVAWWLR